MFLGGLRLASVPGSAGQVCTHSHTSLLARADRLIYTWVEGDATQSSDPVE